MATQTRNRDDREIPPPVSLREAFRYWLSLGFISFGGPTGQISIMRQELVERRHWISEHRFLCALNYCMVLRGPEAQQLATYRHLHRLAHARHDRRDRRRCLVRAAVGFHPDRTHLGLHGLRPCARGGGHTVRITCCGRRALRGRSMSGRCLATSSGFRRCSVSQPLSLCSGGRSASSRSSSPAAQRVLSMR